MTRDANTETTMTKAAEIAVLDATIAKLTPNSYLGPWLASVRAELVRDLETDTIPSPMLPAAARAEAESILKQAREDAAELRRESRDVATKMEADARGMAERIREGARLHLQNAARHL